MTNSLNCGAPITGSVCEYCGIRYGTVFVPASPPPAICETLTIYTKFPHRGGWANTNNGGFRAFCAEEPKADPVEAPTETKPSELEDEEPPEEVKALDAPPVQNRGGAPKSGSLCFENTTTTEALNLVYSVLGSVSMAKLSVSWEA